MLIIVIWLILLRLIPGLRIMRLIWYGSMALESRLLREVVVLI